jgi:hypothetical protein
MTLLRERRLRIGRLRLGIGDRSTVAVGRSAVVGTSG